MPLQRAEQHHAGEGDERPAELDAAHAADRRGTRAGLISSNEYTITTAASAACGMSAMTGREQQQRRQRDRRRDERRDLGARARLAVDRGLRRAAAGRHRAEQAAGHVGQAERQQLPVRLRARLAGRGERARRGDASR